ncbi:unnamed protein product, partial [Mesorhabditis spiculigera]
MSVLDAIRPFLVGFVQPDVHIRISSHETINILCVGTTLVSEIYKFVAFYYNIKKHSFFLTFGMDPNVMLNPRITVADALSLQTTPGHTLYMTVVERLD